MHVRAPSSEITHGIASTQDFGFAMVRPDGFARGYAEQIVDMLEAAGQLTVITSKVSVLLDEQVDGLYPSQHDMPYYPSMKGSMVGKAAMSLVIAGRGDVGAQLKALKGKPFDDDSTIRGRFSARHDLLFDRQEVFARTGLVMSRRFQRGVAAVIKRDDRIHSDETPAEAAHSIRVMFTDDELTEAASRFPGLVTFLSQHLRISCARSMQ
ncbi:MAG TPA: nucleoside-diphosphate kinase [Patescibacteria group bacterium]|nr:nucleoside-diphosphate kinase [Patescibacteria group bacterium]